MIDAFTSMFRVIFEFVKYPLFVVLAFFAIFLFSVFLNIAIEMTKGKRFKKGSRQRLKKKSVFRRLFVDAPHQFVLDLFNKDPDFFPYQGCIIFEGRQGNGKTISMVEFARRMQQECPLAKVTSNLAYKYEDRRLTHWKILTNYKNGINGVIVMIDETQNWFSSRDSQNFPPEMLSVVTQNRKNRRIILGTAQNFYLLAKAIRSQATEVRRCTTLLGCITIVRRFEPILDSEGNVVEFKKRGMYFFVHNEELRNAYDTYKVIENLSESGFKEQQLNADNVTNLSVVVNQNKKRK